MAADRVWMVGPDGGPPEEVEATTEILVPRMVAGWKQCEALPPTVKKSKEKVTDGESA